MFRIYGGLLTALIFAMLVSSYAKANSVDAAANEMKKLLELNLTVRLTLSANSADAIMCLNEVSGFPNSLNHDREIVKKCFINDRLKTKIQMRPDAFSANDNRKRYFYALCSQNYQCNEEDNIFGGRWTKCGHLGTYLDFLTRVKGLPSNIFTDEDGITLCRGAIGF